jgi:phage gp45-like
LSQVTGLNKTNNCIELYPYGYSANAPTNSMVAMWESMGDTSNLMGVAFSTQSRFKGLNPGESQIGNELTKSSIKFDKDGNIIIDAPLNGDIIINALNGNAQITIDQDLNITVSGNININATGNTTITSPMVTIAGNLQVSGSITDMYQTNTRTMANMRTFYNAHTHISATPGNPTSTTSNPI